jgi:hypothetical protein
MPDGMGRCVGCVQDDGAAVLSDLDWNAIFERRPDLAPPGYYEAVRLAHEDSERRYERQGRKRAGSSGRSKGGQFPGLKHGAT